STRPGVSPGERPMELDGVAGFDKAIEADAHIRKCGHKRLSLTLERRAPLRARTSIDAQPAIRRIKSCNARRILAAPCGRIACGKIAKLLGDWHEAMIESLQPDGT